MNKKTAAICLLTFFIGCAGGGALAYTNHQKGMEEQSLLASISKTQDNWEVEQFIREQEEQRPDGLEVSQIATGSRYTGITYNNVSVATVTDTTTPAADDTKESSGLLSGLFNNKNDDTDNPADKQSKTGADNDIAPQSADKTIGRIAIQSGSLNIRAAGNIEGDVIGQAYKDDRVEIIGQEGVWYQIITASGQQGYVSSTYVEIVEE